ncbi:MAG TPA: hypothetical protein VIL26_03425, partial [Clostridia bacterium]
MAKRLISSETESFNKFGGNYEILKLFKDAGFDAYDFSMFEDSINRLIDYDDYKQKARELRKYADSLGIVCNQAHAPFPTVKPGDDEFNKYIFSKIVRAIEV